MIELELHWLVALALAALAASGVVRSAAAVARWFRRTDARDPASGAFSGTLDARDAPFRSGAVAALARRGQVADRAARAAVNRGTGGS